MIGYNSLIILKPNSFIIIVIIFGLITQLEVMIVDAIILKKVNNEIKKTLIDAIFRFYRIQLFETELENIKSIKIDFFQGEQINFFDLNNNFSDFNKSLLLILFKCHKRFKKNS